MNIDRILDRIKVGMTTRVAVLSTTRLLFFDSCTVEEGPGWSYTPGASMSWSSASSRRNLSILSGKPRDLKHVEAQKLLLLR